MVVVTNATVIASSFGRGFFFKLLLLQESSNNTAQVKSSKKLYLSDRNVCIVDINFLSARYFSINRFIYIHICMNEIYTYMCDYCPSLNHVSYLLYYVFLFLPEVT